MRIDVHQHLGIKWVNAKEISEYFDIILLNPAYKYSCQCCVDGFYQQYLWLKNKNENREKYRLLGIYNPKCRVPLEVELGRQYEKGIVGIVLTPEKHGYKIQDIDKVLEFAEDHKMPIFIKTTQDLTQKIQEFTHLTFVILGSYYPMEEMLYNLLKYNNVFFETSGVPESFLNRIPTDRLIYGSGYPYLPFKNVHLIDVISENALKIISIH
ncbi:amidohydrolase family protein [Acidianus ambivalens]|uniref:Amidohydrolase family protein n=2 Tax=Acidianus TaxID=12914 RepID=A0A650CYE6_ACIAM|nr:amidohydrolase family protein [Acidianus ambivalens]MQL54910.1 amidohydrolase family protein [Acidianus ambivalens]QGR22695.1 amidohydrolase family protein [Acidianus ambivalens]